MTTFEHVNLGFCGAPWFFCWLLLPKKRQIFSPQKFFRNQTVEQALWIEVIKMIKAQRTTTDNMDNINVEGSVMETADGDESQSQSRPILQLWGKWKKILELFDESKFCTVCFLVGKLRLYFWKNYDMLLGMFSLISIRWWSQLELRLTGDIKTVTTVNFRCEEKIHSTKNSIIFTSLEIDKWEEFQPT